MKRYLPGSQYGLLERRVSADELGDITTLFHTDVCVCMCVYLSASLITVSTCYFCNLKIYSLNCKDNKIKLVAFTYFWTLLHVEISIGESWLC